MNNGETTRTFLSIIDPETKRLILENIATHYGSTSDEAFAEVCDPEAEHLLDYVTGPTRAATSVLMQKYRLR